MARAAHPVVTPTPDAGPAPAPGRPGRGARDEKMSTLPVVPVAAALAALPVCARRPRDVRRALLAAGVVTGVAVAVVRAAHFVVDPRLRRDPGTTHVPVVHGLRGHLVRLLPFPEAYRDGMRIRFGMENRSWAGFLFGHRYTGARCYHLPAALLVKTPIGALVLWTAGAVVPVTEWRLRPAEPYVLAPAAVLPVAATAGSRDPRRVPPAEVHGLLGVSDSAVALAKGPLAVLLRTGRPVDEVGHSTTSYRR